MIECNDCIHASVCKFCGDICLTKVDENTRNTPFEVKVTCKEFLPKPKNRQGNFRTLKEELSYIASGGK